MKSVLSILLVFVIATTGLYCLAASFPKLDREHDQDGEAVITFPRSMDDLRSLSRTLNLYKRHHFTSVIILFCCAYVYKQTFAIPGSVFMNILAGAVFNFWLAFPLVCVLTATGASCCYALSYCFGRDLISRYFPERVDKMKQTIESNMDSLLFFLLFLRVFPMSPNWFMNMVCPIIGVPLHIFTLSIFLGLMPYNFICVQTGNILSQIRSYDEIFTWTTLCKLILAALVFLLPGVAIKKYRSRNKASSKLATN